MGDAQVILADGTEFFIDKSTYDEHERTVRIYAQHNGGELKENLHVAISISLSD